MQFSIDNYRQGCLCSLMVVDFVQNSAESPFAKKQQFRGNAEVSFGLFPAGKQMHSVASQKMIVDSLSTGKTTGDIILHSPAKLYQSQAEGSGYQQGKWLSTSL